MSRGYCCSFLLFIELITRVLVLGAKARGDDTVAMGVGSGGLV